MVRRVGLCVCIGGKVLRAKVRMVVRWFLLGFGVCLFYETTGEPDEDDQAFPWEHRTPPPPSSITTLPRCYNIWPRLPTATVHKNRHASKTSKVDDAERRRTPPPSVAFFCRRCICGSSKHIRARRSKWVGMGYDHYRISASMMNKHDRELWVSPTSFPTRVAFPPRVCGGVETRSLDTTDCESTALPLSLTLL